MRLAASLDRETWSAFVERNPAGSIFHTPEMHRVFASARGHSPALWATVDPAGDVLALMTPVTITTVGGPLRPLGTRAVAFAEPLVAPGATEQEALGTLLRGYRRHSSRTPVFTEIRPLTDTSRFNACLVASGFRHEPHLNFLLDVTPPEDQLWRKVAPSARRNVARARRLGVTIQDLSGGDSARDAYPILQDVYRRIRVPLPDRSLFDAAAEILGPLGRFTVLLARLEDRPIGVLTLLLYNRVAHYWYTGTVRDYASVRAGDALVWRAIQYARERGCRTLEFGGAGRPNEPYGVRDFKAKYGGALVDHGRYVWTSAAVRARVSKLGYAALRRIGR